MESMMESIWIYISWFLKENMHRFFCWEMFCGFSGSQEPWSQGGIHGYCRILSQKKDMSEGMWADMSLLYTSLKERPAHAEEGPRLFRFATCWGCSTPTMTRSSPSCIFENTNWTWTVLAPSNKKVNLQKLENQGFSYSRTQWWNKSVTQQDPGCILCPTAHKQRDDLPAMQWTVNCASLPLGND